MTTTTTQTFCTTCRSRHASLTRSLADLRDVAHKAARARDGQRAGFIEQITKAKARRDSDRRWLDEHLAVCEFPDRSP
jgi:hypothetical protein